MFSQEQVSHHLELIQSALRFKNNSSELLDMFMDGVNRDEKMGRAIHYENGKTAEWTCYFTNMNADWVYAIIHPLSLIEILPLYYAESYHDECDISSDDNAKSSLMTLMIGDKFVASLRVCPELIAFVVERFHSKNAYTHESLSEIWSDEQSPEMIQERLQVLKKYADGKKNPHTIKPS